MAEVMSPAWITREQAVDLLVLWVNAGLVLIVAIMVLCVALAFVLTRRRFKTYEEYRRAAREQEQRARPRAVPMPKPGRGKADRPGPGPGW